MTDKHHINKDINRYLDDLYGADEIDKLQDIIRSEVDSANLDARIKDVWDESLEQKSTAVPDDKEKLRKEAFLLLKKTEVPVSKQWKISKWMSIAASLLLMITIGWAVYYNMPDSDTGQTTATFLEIKVPYGDKKEILLSDGSRVILNAGTTMRYPQKFTGIEREVYLDGEAFFNVVSNVKQPFIVTSDNVSVKVLGTEFNVKSYGEDELASVSVKSGKVQVETEEISSRLTSGDQITLNNFTKDYQKKKIELKGITYWVQGGLAFYETPIADVAKELTRIYNRNIRFEEGQSFNNLIVGEHDNKSIESVLKSIEYTSGIKFRKEGEDYILYK